MMMIFHAIGKGRAGEQQQHLLTIPINHIFLRALGKVLKKALKLLAATRNIPRRKHNEIWSI